jgi:hypothetical protein
VTRRLAAAAVAAALAATGVLIGVELERGGLGYGEPVARDPCAPHARFPGEGFDGTAQRVALRGLDIAACDLGVTRERLLLALAGREDPPGSPEEMERSVRDGLATAIDEEDLNPAASFLLKQLVQRAPADWALDMARRLGFLS